MHSLGQIQFRGIPVTGGISVFESSELPDLFQYSTGDGRFLGIVIKISDNGMLRGIIQQSREKSKRLVYDRGMLPVILIRILTLYIILYMIALAKIRKSCIYNAVKDHIDSIVSPGTDHFTGSILNGDAYHAVSYCYFVLA